jgi:hypothetical protein
VARIEHAAQTTPDSDTLEIEFSVTNRSNHVGLAQRGRPVSPLGQTDHAPLAPPVDQASVTRQQQAALPLSTDVAQAIAEQHGVCVQPLAMRRIELTTGRVEIVPVPCGSTREDQCRPCADKARRLRMAQCREGWHLDTEPAIQRAKPSDEQQELMATRADLLAAYAECKANDDVETCEQIADSVAELDATLRASGVCGRLAPLDPPRKPMKRSTRRRQDSPNLPRRPIQRRTVGQVFAGRYRPSTFLTLTLDSYGSVDSNGAAVDPERYDYQRAARDAIHFATLLDRFWQNTRRCVGWMCSTSVPWSRKSEALRISTLPFVARSPAPNYARSPRRPTTRCGGLPTITSFTRGNNCRSGIP